MPTIDLGEDLATTMSRPKSNRVIHVYTVPPGLAKLSGVKSIGIAELTAEEELMATKRAAGDGIRLGFELAKESLRQYNGENVTTGDGSADRVWSSMHPKVRMLCVTAYTDVHQPEKDDHTSFIASRQASVG